METADIKPIETTYNGVLFRSRLEARWAMTFDLLNIRWLYEHEAYETSFGRYLPDFWLPDTYLRHKEKQGVLFEVKPEGYKNTHDALWEVAEKLNVGGILACGYEWEDCEYQYVGHWCGLYQIAPPWDNDMSLYRCKCGSSTFEYYGAGNYECPKCQSSDWNVTNDLSSNAYNRAIRYRFW